MKRIGYDLATRQRPHSKGIIFAPVSPIKDLYGPFGTHGGRSLPTVTFINCEAAAFLDEVTGGGKRLQ